MSNVTPVVDIFIKPSELKLAREDFIARIVEPMVARLLHSTKTWDESVVRAHIRMWIAPHDQNMVDMLNETDE